MSYLDRIRDCTRHDPARCLPVIVDGRPLGLAPIETARVLAGADARLGLTADALVMDERIDNRDDRSAILDAALQRAIEAGLVGGRRDELYPVIGCWAEPPVAIVDRAAMKIFGFLAFGVHVNGIVRRKDGIWLWVGQRGWDRAVSPGKLDHVVAGGQPHGLSIMENLAKEAEEEAGLSADLARTARPVGSLSYRRDNRHGVQRDVLFLFDLEMPDSVTPDNRDGEVIDFTLMPVQDIATRVRDTDDFKFNVSAVLIDFLIRHGVIGPDEPDYVRLRAGLHADDRLAGDPGP